MHLYSLESIFEVFLNGKTEITNNDDLNYIVENILDNDNTLEILQQLSLSKSIPIACQAGRLLADTLYHLYNSIEKKTFQRVQEKIMINTTLFLWNLRGLLFPASNKELSVSSCFIELLLFGNPECCSLIHRIFPKSLIQKVQMGRECVEWKLETWNELFKNIQTDYNLVSLQWSKECRTDLSEKLKKTVINFLTVKYSKLQDKKEVYWNHEEFCHQYAWLEKKCKVGKYYLKELLSINEGKLKEKIDDPFDFWNVIEYY